MKFGQVVEQNKRMLFEKNHSENEAGRLVPDLFLFSRKASYEVNASVQVVSIYCDSPQLDIQ